MDSYTLLDGCMMQEAQAYEQLNRYDYPLKPIAAAIEAWLMVVNTKSVGVYLALLILLGGFGAHCLSLELPQTHYSTLLSWGHRLRCHLPSL